MNVEIHVNSIVHAVQRLLNKNQLCKDMKLLYINVLLSKLIYKCNIYIYI